jgi:hypothetical protein
MPTQSKIGVAFPIPLARDEIITEALSPCCERRPQPTALSVRIAQPEVVASQKNTSIALQPLGLLEHIVKFIQTSAL